jgi:hypothetical protein
MEPRQRKDLPGAWYRGSSDSWPQKEADSVEVWRSHQLATACKMARQIRFAVLPAELRCSVSQATSRSTKAYLGRFGGDDSRPVVHDRGFAKPAADIVHLCSWPRRQGISGSSSGANLSNAGASTLQLTSWSMRRSPFAVKCTAWQCSAESAKLSSGADGRCGSRGKLACASSRR